MSSKPINQRVASQAAPAAKTLAILSGRDAAQQNLRHPTAQPGHPDAGQAGPALPRAVFSVPAGARAEWPPARQNWLRMSRESRIMCAGSWQVSGSSENCSDSLPLSTATVGYQVGHGEQPMSISASIYAAGSTRWHFGAQGSQAGANRALED